MSTTITRGNVIGMWTAAVTFNPAAVNTITTAEQTVTVPGVKVGDLVFVNKPDHTTGVGMCSARVSAANTVAVQFVNPTAGSVNPNEGTYVFLIVRTEGDIPAIVKA